MNNDEHNDCPRGRDASAFMNDMSDMRDMSDTKDMSDMKDMSGLKNVRSMFFMYLYNYSHIHLFVYLSIYLEFPNTCQERVPESVLG